MPRESAKAIPPVLDTKHDGFDRAFAKLPRRREEVQDDVSKTVRRIIDRVREVGDEEVRALTRKFDGASLREFEVSRGEFEEAGETIHPADRAALGKAAMRVRDFHRKRIPSSWEVREEGGGVFGTRVRALQRVGIYVPGGKALYPSTVIMNAIPASVVEVPEIIMVSPPGPDGKLRPEGLMAARVGRVQEQIAKQLKTLERAKIARKSLATRGAIIVAKDIAECVALANQYAPEHLLIASNDADRIAKDVQNAGAIFLGHYTPVAVGDYLAGPNHVLPTGGSARFFSPLGVDDFLKRTSVIRFEPPKLRELGLDVIRLAAMEGLTGHGRSVDLRLQKIRRARREREAA